MLEIGTGTGYNAALLAHLLGDHNVASIDVDAILVDLARHRLALAGFHPVLAATDGVHGLPEHGPYDRIVGTCSVPAVPWAWADQLTPTGQILVDLNSPSARGTSSCCTRYPDRLEGRCTARWAAFMDMRHRGVPPTYRSPCADREYATTRTTSTPPRPWWDEREVWFLAQFGLPHGVVHGVRTSAETGRPIAATMTSLDGSWAEVELPEHADGTRTVTEAGPTPLWVAVEHAHTTWTALGRPDWTRLGLTATPDHQWIWLDEPDSRHYWTLAPR